MARKREEKETREGENLTDLIKKIAFGGIGAVSLTQDAVSKLVVSITQQVDKNKEEIIGALANQFGTVLREVDIMWLMKKLLTGLTIKINAEITLGYKKEDKRQ